MTQREEEKEKICKDSWTERQTEVQTDINICRQSKKQADRDGVMERQADRLDRSPEHRQTHVERN